MQYIQQITICGSKDPTPTELVIEPWAKLFVLNEHSYITILAQSESVGCFYIRHEIHKLVVFAWEGCVVDVYAGEEQKLIAKFDNPVPPLP